MKKIILHLCLFSVALYSIEIDDLDNLSLTRLLEIPVKSSSSFNESILSAPASVSVLSEKDWVKYGAKRPIDAISHLTGIVTYPDNIASGSTVRIRGYSHILPRGVAYIIDDVPLNDFVFATADLSFMQLGLTGIKTIEVVRGPGSVNYGTDAFHGVVSLKTQEGYTDASNVKVDVASNNYTSASITNTTVKDNYIIDFTFQGTNQGNQNRNFQYKDIATSNIQNNDRAMKSKYYNSLLKIRSNTDSNLQYELGFIFLGSDNKDYPGFGRATGNAINHNLGIYDRLDHVNTLNILQGKLKYNAFENISLSLSTFAWENDRTLKRYFLNSPTAPTLPKVFLQKRQIVQQKKGIKLQASSKQEIYSTLWSLNIGYDATDIKKAHSDVYTVTGALAKGANEPYNGLNRKVSHIAVEFKTNINNWQFNYGLRLDEYNSFGAQYSPRLGTSYLYSDTGVIKFLYGQAFRAGSAAEQSSTSQSIGDPNIKPETINSYEVIWIQAQQNAKVEVSLFKTDWKNAIVRSTDGPIPEFVNRNKNSSQGIEINANYTYNKDLTLNLGISYIKSTSDTTGNDYVGYPEQTLDFGIGYVAQKNVAIYWSNRVMNKMSATTQVGSKALAIYWQSDLHVDYTASKNLRYALQVYNIFNRNNHISSLPLDPNGMSSEQSSIMLSAIYSF